MVERTADPLNAPDPYADDGDGGGTNDDPDPTPTSDSGDSDTSSSSSGSSSGSRTTASDPSDPPDPFEEADTSDDSSGSSSGSRTTASDPSDPPEPDTDDVTRDPDQAGGPTQPGMGADTEQQSEGAEDPAATPSDPAPDAPEDFTGINEPTEGDAPNPTGATSAPPELADTTTPGGAQPAPTLEGDQQAEGGERGVSGGKNRRDDPRTTARDPANPPAAPVDLDDLGRTQRQVLARQRAMAAVQRAEAVSRRPGVDVSPSAIDTTVVRDVEGKIGIRTSTPERVTRRSFRASPMAPGPTAAQLEAGRKLIQARRRARQAAEGSELDFTPDQFTVEADDGETLGDVATGVAGGRRAAEAGETGGSLLGPPGDVERGIYQAGRDITTGLQEDFVDPASDITGDILEARQRAESVQAGLDPEGERLETSTQDLLRAPDQELDDPGVLESGADKFTEGAGDIAASIPRAPESIRNVGVLGFDAGKFTLENPQAAPAAAAGFTVSRLSEAAEAAIENPIRTGGQLAGTALLFGGTAAASSRVGLATRAAIQPGEEALGIAGGSAFRGGASALESVGDVAPGRIGGALDRAGGGVRRAGQLTFPNNEPLLISEEAGIAAIGKAGELAVRGGRAARSRLPSTSTLRRVKVEPRAGAGLVPPRIEVEGERDTITADDIADPDNLGGRESVQTRRERSEGNQFSNPPDRTPLSTRRERGLERAPREEREGYVSREELRQRRREGGLTPVQKKLLEKETEASEAVAVEESLQTDTEQEARGRQREAERMLQTESERSALGVRTDVLSGVEADQGLRTQLRTEPLTRADQIGRLGVELDTELETELDTELDTELEQETETETETELETELKTELEQEAEQETEQELELEVEFEQETEQEIEVELEPDETESIIPPEDTDSDEFLRRFEFDVAEPSAILEGEEL